MPGASRTRRLENRISYERWKTLYMLNDSCSVKGEGGSITAYCHVNVYC